MHLFGWLDLRTLVVCQIPLAGVFALALFAIKRIYTHLRGIDLIAMAFALWVPATMLLVAQGFIPAFVALIGGNLLTIGCYVLLYRGVLVYFESKGLLPLLYDVASVAAAVIIYFSVVHDLAFPRIVALSLVVALVRGLIAAELFSRLKTHSNIFFFTGFLIFFSVLPLAVALLSMFDSALTHAGLEAFNTVSDVAFLSGSGLFLLTIFLEQGNQKTQQSGQFDVLTGSLNRRAIEEALTIEIARSTRTNSPVSVMLVEVDHFSSLASIHGHQKSDQTLCTVISTIGNMLRFYDKCGRLADDRFLVVLPENVAEHAVVIANRFREALKSSSMPHDQPAVTLSIGVTQSGFKELTADVLARAEDALLSARSRGRDCAHLAFNTPQQYLASQPSSLDRLASGSRVAVKVAR